MEQCTRYMAKRRRGRQVVPTRKAGASWVGTGPAMVTLPCSPYSSTTADSRAALGPPPPAPKGIKNQYQAH